MDYVAQIFTDKRNTFLSSTPFLQAILTTVSNEKTRLDLQGGGGEKGGGELCSTGINRDLHTGTCGLTHTQSNVRTAHRFRLHLVLV